MQQFPFQIQIYIRARPVSLHKAAEVAMALFVSGKSIVKILATFLSIYYYEKHNVGRTVPMAC